MDPNANESNTSDPAVPSPKVYTLGDQILTEVEFDDQEPPIDDGASDWTDVGDNVAENEAIDDADIDGGFVKAPDIEAVDMAFATFRGHSDCVYSCAIHPTNPRIVITGGGDDLAYLWKYSEVAAGSSTIEFAIELPGHKDSVTAVGFNFDGTLCLTAAYDGVVCIWSVADGSKLQSLEGPEDVEWAEWHSKGNAVVAGSKDGTIWMWLAHSGQCVQVFAGHDGPVNCGGFSCDGKWVLSGGDDGSVRVWAPKTGQCKVTFDNANGHEAPVTCIKGSSDGDMILSGSVDGTVKLFQISGKRILQVFRHSEVVETESGSAGADIDEDEAAWGDIDGEDRSNAVECVGFSNDEHRWVASGGMDKTLKIWDFTTGSCRSVCRHADGVVSLSWHLTRPVVVTASLDRSIRIWDARSGTMVAELTGHTNIVTNFTMRTFSASNQVTVIADAGLPAVPTATITPPQPSTTSNPSGISSDIIVSVSDDFTAKVFVADINQMLV